MTDAIDVCKFECEIKFHILQYLQQMKQFTKYLSNYTKNVQSMTDQDKLTMILLEVQSVRYPIGLEGNGFFTVTYKFLGGVSNTKISKGEQLFFFRWII